MLSFLPPWDGIHVLVVHFPVALLIVSPLFVLLDLIFIKRTPVLGFSALILLLLGVSAAFLAVGTGEAAAELVDRTPQIDTLLEHHQENAELARTGFAIVSLIYAGLLLVPPLIRKPLGPTLGRALRVICLLLFLTGGVFLGIAAHDGGLLVHKLGVRAMFER